MELPNTSPQAIELNPSCSGQAHFNRPDTGPGYKNTEPRFILAILRVPSIVVHSEARMPSPARLSKRFRAAGANGRLDLSLAWREYLRTYIKDHTRYDQGPEIHSKPRRVLLPVGEAQVTGWVSGPLKWDAGIQ